MLRVAIPTREPRRQHSIGVRPASVQAVDNCAIEDASLDRPCGDRLSLAVCRDKSITRCVSSLFKRGRPAAIRRRVVAVGVLAFKGVLWCRFSSKIGQEVREAVQPSRANRDAATTVTVITDVGRRVAALLHGSPRPVLGRATGDSARRTMHELALTGVAAAALCFSGGHVMRAHDADRAAVTPALVEMDALGVDVVQAENHQAGESLASQVDMRSADSHVRQCRLQPVKYQA
jgi:hypothetical protein